MKKLEKIYHKSDTVKINQRTKIIIMSDCHRGIGNLGDNFLPNQLLFFGALEYYYKEGFTYIELGDGDELWENRKLKPIIDIHSDAYWLMSEFYKNNRFYMLYGNHDIVKRKKLTTEKYYADYFCENNLCILPLFPGISVHEGLILKTENNNIIFLIHGHQCSFLNSSLWPLGRFLVRYLWNPLEIIGFKQPTSSATPHTEKIKVEKKLSAFSEKEKMIVIAGHTHRPVCPAPGEGLYFNDGSCVHTRCITGIEIENNCLSLIKWAFDIDDNRRVFVSRKVLEGPYEIEKYFNL